MGPVTSVPDSLRRKGCLPGASTIVVVLSKTFKLVFLFFPTWLLSSALSFPVGCHHSRVNEKWGNFPEGHGKNGWASGKSNWEPGRQVGSQLGCKLSSNELRCKNLCLSRSEERKGKTLKPKTKSRCVSLVTV